MCPSHPLDDITSPKPIQAPYCLYKLPKLKSMPELKQAELENKESVHPFTEAPHCTLFMMSLPLLLSLIAEPLTGLADTAFIAKLGSVPLASVGVGATALTSMFWIFNFLGVGTQTEIAKALGSGDRERVRRISTIALTMGLVLGVIVAGIGFYQVSAIVTLLGADQVLHDSAVSYLKIRLIGAPAILITFAAFGILRGLHDMKSQFIIAVSINLINIVLDPLLIFGLGPFPRLGVAGAAMASTAAQWTGAIWALWPIQARAGFSKVFKLGDSIRLLSIGRDMFIRTGMLTLFLMFTTRGATLISADAGAAHHALRQFWLFTALFLDAYAVAGQSLIAYFVGKQQQDQVKKVAKIVCIWSLAIGNIVLVGMIFGQGVVEYLIVPETALELFGSAWIVMALFQPLNALAFGTDGIHWGTGDFRYLRNGMIFASVVGVAGLYMVNPNTDHALLLIWGVTGVWIGLRTLFGVLRIWPGIGRSPFSYK